MNITHTTFTTTLEDNHAHAAKTLADAYNWRLPAAYDVLVYLNADNAGAALTELLQRIRQYSSPFDQVTEFMELLDKARS